MCLSHSLGACLTVYLCLGLWLGSMGEWLAWWPGSKLWCPPNMGICEGGLWLATSSYEKGEVLVTLL